MEEENQLASPLYCHAWSPHNTELAIAVSCEILIYKRSGSGYHLIHTLSEHQDHVTSLSWSSNNRLVSCSSDRNAYVWTLESGKEWKPTLVLLRIPKGARCVGWNAAETKFVVGSVGIVAICWFDEENNWWVSKHAKVKGTVLSIEWHSGGILFACGSTDGRAVNISSPSNREKVISGFVKGIDKKAGDAVWGDKLPLGTVCGDFNVDAWVHSVAFSPSGNIVAWTAHNSTLSIASPADNYQTTLKTPFLPMLALLFISETHLIGAGHDAVPILFVLINNEWKFSRKLEATAKKEVSNTAMNKFKLMDTKGQSEAEDATSHGSITTIQVVARSGANVTKFSTSALDGKVVVWDVLSLGIANLRI